MRFTDVEAWKEHCRRSATDRDADRAVLSSGWASAGITPPPAHGAHEARIPIERAGRLIEEAGELEGHERARRLKEAVAWLEAPHPRTPRELRAAMKRMRDRAMEELADRR